jgi:two-component system, cell cycle response regulator DivK
VGSHTPGPLVLVVDDNEQNRKLVQDVLRAAGFRTLEAASGREGIALAIERLPDVVLLDLLLPDLDGVEVARELKGNARTAPIPLVALTAVRVGGEGPLQEAGFAGHLEKPIRVADFPAEVRSYCTGRDVARRSS